MIERERVGDRVEVTFALSQDEVHEQVYVVGDFNAWDPDAHPLTPDGRGRVAVTVRLVPGRSWAFRYRTASDAWFNDPDADSYAPHEFGGFNGVVRSDA
jgi:1,4-alpha-glucan branching enzyme